MLTWQQAVSKYYFLAAKETWGEYPIKESMNMYQG